MIHTDSAETDIYAKALAVLRQATVAEGILALATTEETENYTRVWARDSMMAGYAGLLAGDEAVTAGMKASLYTLARHQSPLGIIPSNVGIGTSKKVSYGGTAGRVDASLWYVVGLLLYSRHTGDQDLLQTHGENLRLALQTLDYWEYNGRHLLYTPLSGNWADEYPLHGYLLYDNCLRLWGLELYAEVVDDAYITKAKAVRAAIRDNFFVHEGGRGSYHPNLYQRTLQSLGEVPYAVAGFNPSRYYDLFDCGGTGLALMLSLYTVEEADTLCDYLATIWAEVHSDLTPAFWPVVHEGDELWADLKMNYAYNFKNLPHHFHNGGIWPIMMGWLCTGLARYGKHAVVSRMLQAYEHIAASEDYQFSEYIRSDDLTPAGKAPLCYSAAGYLLMYHSHNTAI